MNEITLNEIFNGEFTVNEELAKRAKAMNSFSEYKEGSETLQFQKSVKNAVKIAEMQKEKVDLEYHDKIDQLLLKYVNKLQKNIDRGNEIDARVPSIMIAGGSNFPTAKKEKQNNARDKNMQELQEINAILEKIGSVGKGGISADDNNALSKLENKLANLEESQKIMKAVNAFYRKNKTLDECPSISSDVIEKLKVEMASSWHISDKPFATFSLSNNNSEIRRIKGRIAELKRSKETVFNGWNFEGGKVFQNEETNRLCIAFDAIPEQEMRTKLKSNGFRWAPSVGVWQRQFTDNALYAIRRIQEIIEVK